MKVLFSELDGTTWQQDLPDSMLSPEIKAPIYPSLARTIFSVREGSIPLDEAIYYRVRRYQRIGISGDIAFYDRVLDAEEIL